MYFGASSLHPKQCFKSVKESRIPLNSGTVAAFAWSRVLSVSPALAKNAIAPSVASGVKAFCIVRKVSEWRGSKTGSRGSSKFPLSSSVWASTDALFQKSSALSAILRTSFCCLLAPRMKITVDDCY